MQYDNLAWYRTVYMAHIYVYCFLTFAYQPCKCQTWRSNYGYGGQQQATSFLSSLVNGAKPSNNNTRKGQSTYVYWTYVYWIYIIYRNYTWRFGHFEHNLWCQRKV